MFGKCRPSLDIDTILSKVSEGDILNHYFGISSLPTLINSPFRSDKNASMRVMYNTTDNILFLDFGTKESWNLWSFLMDYWNLGFLDTLNKIYDDIPKMSKVVGNAEHSKRRSRTISDIKLECKTRKWRKYDLEYWEEYGISKEWLEFAEIYPISHVIMTKDNQTLVIPAEKYAYVYVERKDDKVTLKIYQPKSLSYKWMNNHDSSVWDLWTKIPDKGDNLIITSSRKDALCIWENSGIPALSLQGEGYIPKPQVIEQLKSRYKHIFILYDNDFTAEENHGRLFGAKLASLFNLSQIEIPEEYNSKDTSDLAKNHGRETVRKVILDLIKQSTLNE